MKRFAFGIVVGSLGSLAFGGSSASWLCYPGDFEVYHAQQVQSRRLEWGGYTPVMWPQYTAYPVVRFKKNLDLVAEEDLDIAVDGSGTYSIPGRPTRAFVSSRERLKVGPCKGELVIVLQNHAGLPAIWAKGRTIRSDESWRVDWLDENWLPPGIQAGMDDPSVRPADWKLAVKPLMPVSVVKTACGGVLADFGRESFGYVTLCDIAGSGRVKLIYGESREEALADGVADVWELIDVNPRAKLRIDRSRAFRYVHVIPQTPSVSVGSLTAEFEYLPLERKGFFKCDDPLVNRIWEVAAETLHLSTREFFLDGLKRDRWLWCGDACQSFLMNYYLFADNASVKRTLWALRGKDPVVRHVNTILDYTFYWFIAIGDYYLYSGDDAFVKAIWPRMVTLMDFCLKRSREDGFYEEKPGDWVFVDWAPEPLENSKGPVAVEQMLFARALETMATCAGIVGDPSAATYRRKSQELRSKILPVFYDTERGVVVHAADHALSRLPQVAKYANIFAMLYGYFEGKERERVVNAGVLDPKLMPIDTPYMRFYELEALCAIGRQEQVLDEMRSYWGGMLEKGATTFWELYRPGETGKDVYEMYGRPFGRSLCHAWGASPLYLLGRYYLGVRPLSPGYKTYSVSPCLGGLGWMEGRVPTPTGDISVSVRNGRVRVKGNGGVGTLCLKGSRRFVNPYEEIEVDQ